MNIALAGPSQTSKKNNPEKVLCQKNHLKCCVMLGQELMANGNNYPLLQQLTRTLCHLMQPSSKTFVPEPIPLVKTNFHFNRHFRLFISFWT
ncbi:hypothetical protein EUGRSUZ_F00637 [Eucalyptus grandis]|uniref:Uncharacterized protein n=2 Tax=Eucalyptus grandis TaxID=71139 RepID=A0ACC3KBZ6_EUCGR|nr:hypothetical protein EUGRSUZ_F00637 [Eucalyptus grandis]